MTAWSATALLGKGAPNLSPSVVARLRGEWEADHARWQRRDLSARRYVYIWADGVYPQARMEPQAECMLVLIGATPEGKKELLGFQIGIRESAQSWRELLVDLKARGLVIAPELATAELAARLREESVVLLDVRPSDEYGLGHLPGAINIPLRELEQRLSELPQGQEIVAYCRGLYCVLSFEAVAALRERGFQVRRVEEGFPEWKAAGLPIEIVS